MSQSGSWFTEIHKTQGLTLKINKILHQNKSKYQDILVFNNADYGNVLVLDGCYMLSDIDEHMYHKAITTYGMQNVSRSQDLNILVIGAGDGGVVRNLLQDFDKRIKNITMVEIDQEVIDVSRKYFPNISCELNNPKLDLKVEDALAYVDSVTDSSFDLILCDSTDPVGFAAGLIEENFYLKIQRILKNDGIFCAQSGSPFFQKDELQTAQRNLSKVFNNVHTYYAPMLVYPGSLWSYTVAGKKILNKENLNIQEFT